jgi:hypothetical protein
MGGCEMGRLLMSRAFANGSEAGNSKLEVRNSKQQEGRLDSLFDIRICFKFRISSFEFWISREVPQKKLLLQ